MALGTLENGDQRLARRLPVIRPGGVRPWLVIAVPASVQLFGSATFADSPMVRRPGRSLRKARQRQHSRCHAWTRSAN